MSPVIASPPSTTSAQNSPLESFLRSAFSRTGRFAALQPGPAAAMSYTPTAAPAFASVSGPAWAPPMSAGGSALLARMGPRLIEPAAPAPYTAPTPPPPATSAVSTEAGDSWIPIGSTSKAQPARSLAQRIAPAPAPALTPGPSANYTFQQQGFPPYYATSGAGSSRPQGKRRTPEPEGDDEEDVEPQYWNRQFKRSRGSGKGKG